MHRLVSLDPSTPALKEARRLALDFRDRKLVKCAFEKLVQRRERMVGRIFADEGARARAASDIAKASSVDPELVYLDVPTTPSVPYTYSNEALRSVGLLKMEGSRRVVKAVPLDELPLLRSISGFMDMLRVYTTAENRSAVEKATIRLFKDQGITAGAT
jgi:hypothetical protein